MNTLAEKRPKATRRNRYAAPIGGIFVILCIVGFITLVVICFQFTQSLLDNTKKKAEYEKMLLPVVMFDPAPFEGAENFDQLSMLQTCIWATLLGDNRDNYAYDDQAMLVVPSIDVDVTAQKLFGPDAKLVHQSFGNFDDSYLYDEEIKSYHVPITTMTGFFTPKVMEISKKGDVVTLKVGYIPPSTALNLSIGSDEDNAPEPAKYMIYELHKAKTGYYINAIRDIEGASIVPGVSISFMPIPDDLLNQGSSAGELLTELPSSDTSESGASSGEESTGSSSEDDASDNGSSSDGSSSEGETSASVSGGLAG